MGVRVPSCAQNLPSVGKPALGQVLTFTFQTQPAPGGSQNIYMANVTRENIGILNDKITVSLNKEDYYPAFDKAIKDYSKKANIPGFRKGMVPPGIVKKMYGASIFYDEVVKSVEKKLQEYLSQEKPEIFAQPLPMEIDLRSMDMNNPTDYDFHFEIGLKPEVNIDVLSTSNLTLHKVSVTDAMVDEEIERLKTRHGKMSEPESVNSEEDVLNVLFKESDADGNPVENGISKENSLLVKYFTPEVRAQLMSKKKDDTLVIQLSKAFEEKEREWVISDLGIAKEVENDQKFFKLTIVKIGLVEKRELNIGFFKEVFPAKDIETETEFREELKNQIQQHWDSQSRVQLQDQIYHLLLDTPIELPEQFLKHWMARGGEKVKSIDEVEAEFPSFSKQLKWTLISDKIIKDNNLDVSQEELRENMRKEVMQYFGQTTMTGDMNWLDTYIDRMMKEEKQVDSSYHRLITEKLFTWAEGQVTPKEKEVSPEELNAMQHHHSH